MSVMHFDLPTLYSLVIGTLLVSACMTFWERQARPQRRRELVVLASGYGTLAIGCAAATMRTRLPGVSGACLSNLVIMAGYLLVLEGVSSLSGRRYRMASIAILLATALMWAVGGVRWLDAMWSYTSGLPIAAACGLTAWEMGRTDRMRHLRSRRVVVALAGGHAIFNAGRALVLPFLAEAYGKGIVLIAAKFVMYEGVLYSVGLPMALLALIREEAHQQLLEASRTDYLTGIGNRRWFFEEGLRRVRAGHPISLLLFDLDHFKAINDRHGHAMGDQILRTFAQVVRSVTGEEAILARMGGEEFAALLPGHDSLSAKEIGQVVSKGFAETVSLGEAGIAVKATVSIGLAQLGAEAPDLESLLSSADRALYAAKALGRNRIEQAGSVGLVA